MTDITFPVTLVLLIAVVAYLLRVHTTLRRIATALEKIAGSNQPERADPFDPPGAPGPP